MVKVVFLDRDGVINRKAPEGQYITRWEDFEFLSGVEQAIVQLHRAGYVVIVASNQRGVARGFLSLAELEEIHQRMLAHLSAAGTSIDAVYFCPHDLEPPCACRKPAPGMLLQAARDHGIDLSASWIVGDSDIDVQAGKNAGCRTIRVLRQGMTVGNAADLTVGSLLEASEALSKLN